MGVLMQIPIQRRSIVYRSDGRPAWQGFKGRVTQSMVDEHGSYEAARAWLDGQNRSEGEQ